MKPQTPNKTSYTQNKSKLKYFVITATKNYENNGKPKKKKLKYKAHINIHLESKEYLPRDN